MIDKYKKFLNESKSKFEVTEDSITISNSDWKLWPATAISSNIQLLNSNYLGWVKVSRFEHYLFHVTSYEIYSPYSKTPDLHIFHDLYSLVDKIHEDNSLISLGLPVTITKCELIVPNIRITKEDPFGEEDWND